jgi:hypothetical protein
MPVSARHGLFVLAVSAMLLSFFQSACFLPHLIPHLHHHHKGKTKTPVAPMPPVRVVLLPFNAPAGNKDLHWVALAAPILMARVTERAQDLVAVPLWEAMPTAIESAGASRTFTQESTASAANWLAAKWATLGEISPARTGVSMIIDFIPAKSSEVPFRYMKTRRIESLGAACQEALRQFLRYLAAKPLELPKGGDQGMPSIRVLAEALDREYGWFGNADPGKAQEIVADLARVDDRLARLLFNPSLYPSLSTQTK